jgi:hypothetical protein
LRLTASQPVRLGIGPPFGTLDQILTCSSFSSDSYFILHSKAPSLTRKQVCSLQCNHCAIRSLTPNNTVPPHLRLCSLFVASYDSQGLRWRYSNPPPHGEERDLSTISYIGIQFVPHRNHITSFKPASTRGRERSFYYIIYRNSVCTSQESHYAILTRFHTGKSEIFLLYHI